MHECKKCGCCQLEEKVLSDVTRIDWKVLRYMDIVEVRRTVLKDVPVNKSLIGRYLEGVWSEEIRGAYFDEPQRAPLMPVRY